MSRQRDPVYDDSSIAALTARAFGQERRTPEHVQADDVSLSILAGVIAIPDARTSEADDVAVALAVKKVREACNHHGCSRQKVSDPPCMDRNHWRDVAQARVTLWALGLPCGLECLPLADAVMTEHAAASDAGQETG